MGCSFDNPIVGVLLTFSNWARNRLCMQITRMSLSDILSEMIAKSGTIYPMLWKLKTLRRKINKSKISSIMMNTSISSDFTF